MAAALRRAEPPLPSQPLGAPGPAPPPPPGEPPPLGTLPTGAAAGQEEAEPGPLRPAGAERAVQSPAESETAAAWAPGGAAPCPSGAEPARPRELEGAEAAWEPLLQPAAGGPPSAPLSGGALPPASPRLAPQAGSSPPPEAAWGQPGLARTPSQSRSLSCGQPAPGGGAGAAECCCVLAEAGSGGEEECPICTEPYDGGPRRPVPLNCSHVLCRHCLRAIMDAAGEAEIGRVRCPICRQKTPMLEWEICKLQEELLLLHQEPAPAHLLVLPMAPVLPARRPGLCGALEHHFQVRFHTSRMFRMFGCLPCGRYPLCLVSGLGGLERRCRCCYLLSLAALLAAETFSLLLIFLPIVLLVLLFLILDK